MNENSRPGHSTVPSMEFEKASSSPDSGTVEAATPVEERALLRKIDLKVLPALTLLYLLSFLDRSNGIISTLPLFLYNRV